MVVERLVKVFLGQQLLGVLLSVDYWSNFPVLCDANFLSNPFTHSGTW